VPPCLTELAREIQSEHRSASDASVRAVAHARRAGELLIAAKEQLPHGKWLPWLKEHCQLKPRTAQSYMQLARLPEPEAQRVADLSFREALKTVRTPKPTSTALFDHDRILEAAFAHFRATGFPYRRVPVHVAMQTLNKLAASDATTLLSTTVGYDVADSYHPHRFHATTAQHHSPVDAFNRDDLLRRALSKELEQGKVIPAGYFGGLSIVSDTQPCSNFRPGVALHYYRRYCQAGATVLDTSTGYGGRLVGFLASGLAGRYIGIDPNRATHDGNARLAADLGFADAIELHCLPAEDMNVELIRESCDFALTSPPYFSKEHYSEEPTQSWRRYPTADGWRDGFLRPMLRLQFDALKSGAINVVNIDDVTIGGTVHRLTDWTTEVAAEIGFELIEIDSLQLGGFWSKVQDFDSSEPIFVFRKP
jgi:hypothetical protein